jgi:hypothetical protein
MTEVEGGAAALTVYVDGEWSFWDGLELEDHDLEAWVSVGAGHEYVVEVDRASCMLDVTYTAIEDRWEPNDSSDDATTITGSVQGWFQTAEVGESLSSDDWADWYRYASDESPLTVTLTDVPGDIEGFVQLWDASDPEWPLTWSSAWNGGDDVVVEVDPTHSGAILIEVRPYGAETYGLGDPPAELLAPYTLNVEEEWC